MSVIVLAVLGLMLDDSLTRLNALKQAMSFAINAAAAVFFLFSGKVVWITAIVMATGSVLGGILGGKLASKSQGNSAMDCRFYRIDGFDHLFCSKIS